ncbi:MAG TPA: HEAT repeat domain-containing protein [Planctomycetaceae bacterium]|nr:HEAT repeat domain-containing protein [Planctomycetaceae bacterium]
MSKSTPEKAKDETSSETLATAARGPQIRLLIERLSSPRAAEREEARGEIVEFGAPAVPELLTALETANDRGRLEACKALAEIAHPSATPALIKFLEDEHQDLRWVAAEGLLNIGGWAVTPLLLALIDRAWAHTILDGAVHVLRGWSRRIPDPVFERLISAAMHSPEPGVSVPTAAEAALAKWREIWNEEAASHRTSIVPGFAPRGDRPWYDRRL